MTGMSPLCSTSFGKMSSARLFARSFCDALDDPLAELGVLDARHQLVRRQRPVPQLQRLHLAELGHRLAVGADAGHGRRPWPRRRFRPLSRQATTKLAARRLTSHSHGAGSVSSRSLMEKMTLRSGVAKPPKLHRWASPQHWTRMPGGRRGRQVGRHREGRAAVERERGADHAPVAQGEQVGHAPLLRRQDQSRPRRAGRRGPSRRRATRAGRPPAGPCPRRSAPPAIVAGRRRSLPWNRLDSSRVSLHSLLTGTRMARCPGRTRLRTARADPRVLPGGREDLVVAAKPDVGAPAVAELH